MRTFGILPFVTLLLVSKFVLQLTGKSAIAKGTGNIPEHAKSLEIKTLPPKEPYPTIRRQIEEHKRDFCLQLDSAKTPVAKSEVLKAAGTYLAEAITEKLIPHWYGTPWSFEGHTETPGKGSIACGYFVSTVLSHSGFNLNRYKIAQQRPSLEVLTLHQNHDFIEYPQASVSELSDSLRKHAKEGLYIFGQQFHVGFMLIKDHQISLIHSCYLGERPSVTSEKITQSKIMYDGSYIFFGEISTNKVLIDQWLHSRPIQVKTD